MVKACVGPLYRRVCEPWGPGTNDLGSDLGIHALHTLSHPSLVKTSKGQMYAEVSPTGPSLSTGVIHITGRGARPVTTSGHRDIAFDTY